MKIGHDFVGVTTPFFCVDRRGHLLMHRRSAKCRDEQGRWDTGSGKLEFGLTLSENVLKEVSEEYGCRGQILEQLPAFDLFREHDGAKTHWVVVPFFVRVSADEARVGEPDKIDEIGWFTLDNLPSPLHSGLAQSLIKFRGLFEKYLKA